MLRNVNVKRLIPLILAVLAVILVSDFLLHTVILGSAYQATASLWRTQDDMKAHMAWLFGGQALAAVFFSIIFAKGYEGQGLPEGVRYGLLIGPFSAAHCLIQYAVTPMPLSILAAWVAGAIVQAVLAGIAAASVYRR